MHHSQVRALVRDVAKAKEVLSCEECTTADGVFIGDVTDPASLKAPFDGVKQLVVLTGEKYRTLFHTLPRWLLFAIAVSVQYKHCALVAPPPGI